MNKAKNIKFELFLIRHAESLGNIGGTPENASVFEEENSILSEDGELQAKLLSKRFANYKFDHIISSPLIRTVQTAAELIKGQPKNNSPVLEIYPEAIETGFHDLDMIYGLKEIKEHANINFDLKMAKGIKETRNLMYPSILNTKEQEYERGLRLSNYLKNRFDNGEKIAFVAHGTFNSYIIKAILHIGIKREMRISSNNTSVTRIIFYNDFHQGNKPEYKLSYLNDTSHLYDDFPEMGFI